MPSAPYRKHAALGGSGNDSTFESAMSDLAHAHVREKAPGLMDYELGFQLLDRDEDKNRGVGILGFKIANQLAYVPIFFLNGRIKGHEMMILKDQQQYRPLKEAWVNRVLRRKPMIIGEQGPRDAYNFGARQPRLQDLAYPTGLKFASDIRADLLPGAAIMAKAALSRAVWPDCDLREFLKTAGDRELVAFQRLCGHYPQVRDSLNRFYDSAELLKLADDRLKSRRQLGVFRAAGEVNKPYLSGSVKPLFSEAERSRPDSEYQAKEARQKVEVLRLHRADTAGLTQSEKEQLLADQILVRDKRAEEEVSKAYKMQLTEQLTNPTQTGVYSVLLKNGNFARCLVLLHPHSTRGVESAALVVSLEKTGSEHDQEEAHPTRVWIRRRHDDPTGRAIKDEVSQFVADLPAAEELPLTSKSKFLLLDKRGRCTCPFSISGYATDPESGLPKIKVYEHDYFSNDTPKYDGTKSTDRKDHNYGSWLCWTGRKGAELRSTGDELYLPDGMRYLKLSDRDSEPECCDSMTDASDSETKKLPFTLGTENDLREYIFRNTRLLKAAHDGSEVRLNGERLLPLDALTKLVCQWGLREDAAREILKEATAARGRYVSCHVKLASPYPGFLEPSSPVPEFPQPLQGGGLMGDTYPESYASNQVSTVAPRGYEPPDWRNTPAPDIGMANAIGNAARSGQKEMLDASAMASILNMTRQDEMIDSGLPRLKSALNTLGEYIVKLYAHGDKFQDRFGKSDMPALEDLIVSNFDKMGDLILELETKETGEAPGEESFVEIDHTAD